MTARGHGILTRSRTPMAYNHHWFYFGSWIGEAWTSNLKVDGDRLSPRSGNEYVELLPNDIVEIKEFGFNNPFLLVVTTQGNFHVGASARQYDDVVRILERYGGSGFRA